VVIVGPFRFCWSNGLDGGGSVRSIVEGRATMCAVLSTSGMLSYYKVPFGMDEVQGGVAGRKCGVLHCNGSIAGTRVYIGNELYP
jgi:hypothetical protein